MTEGEFVPAYWEFHRLSRGDRAERLASEDVFWAWDVLFRQIHSEPFEALRALIDLAEAAPDEESLLALGAGPIEDLLTEPDAALVQAVDEAAREHRRFRLALSAATIEGQRIEQLLRFRD